MNSTEIIITILLVALATAATRFAPFILLRGKNTPKYLEYLGRALPAAVFGMLVVYCLRSLSFTAPYFALPEIIGVVSVVLLHLAFRKTLLSVIGGTGVYLILVNLIFV